MKKTLLLAFILLATVMVYGDYSSSGTGIATGVDCTDCVALTTETSGNYAAGDGEAGNATGVACASPCVDISSETNLASGNGVAVTGDTVGLSFIGVMLTASASQTNITNDTAVAVTFNQETVDTSAFHDNVTNNSRVTIPTGLGGKYLLIGNAYFNGWTDPPASTFTFNAVFRVNGTTYQNCRQAPQGDNAESAVSLGQNVSCIVSLVAGDYVELVVSHTTGDNNPDISLQAFQAVFLGT